MNAKEIFDPTGERNKQFNRILDFVGESSRPKTDYSALSHVEFSSIHFLRRCFEIQASFMFLLRSFAAAYGHGFIPENIAQKGGLSLQEILDWGRQLTPEILCESHCIYSDIGLTAFLIDLKFEEVFTVRELEIRMRNRPLSAELILLEWERLDRITEIQKLLQVDRIKSFKSNLREHEDMDIKQNAWVNALKYWRQPSALVTKNSPLPAFPLDPFLPMLPAEKKFWKGPMTRAWNQGRKSWMREAVPIFQGDKEISGKVRDAQREQWRTIKRRKPSGTVIRNR